MQTHLMAARKMCACHILETMTVRRRSWQCDPLTILCLRLELTKVLQTG